MGEHTYYRFQSREDSWGWAFLCSIMAHVVAAVALATLLNTPRPTMDLPGPIKVNLISMPAAPKLQAKPASIPIPKEPPPPQTVKKIALKPEPVRPTKPKSAPIIKPDVVIPLKQVEESEPDPAVMVSQEVNTSTQEELPLPAAPSISPIASTAEPGIEASPAASLDGNVDALATYSHQIRERIDKAKRYPMMARKAGKQGSVVVEFRLDRNGKLLDSQITGSCGIKQLDRAAIKALKRASPFTPLPESLESPHTFNLQINFSLAG